MKTGYVCASGLNIVATVERQGRQLLAVVLGATSGRERGELAAQMFLRGFSGQLPGQGIGITSLANTSGVPKDMRPFICGKQAKAYVAQRAEEFPFGLEGQPTYLADEVAGITYEASALGKLRVVPLPRPRPLWAPAPRALMSPEVTPAKSTSIPLPRPRPSVRLALRP